MSECSASFFSAKPQTAKGGGEERRGEERRGRLSGKKGGQQKRGETDAIHKCSSNSSSSAAQAQWLAESAY